MSLREIKELEELTAKAVEHGYTTHHDAARIVLGLNPDERLIELVMMQRWLREKHESHLAVQPFQGPCYEYMLWSQLLTEDIKDGDIHKTYENALQDGISKVLTLL